MYNTLELHYHFILRDHHANWKILKKNNKIPNRFSQLITLVNNSIQVIGIELVGGGAFFLDVHAHFF